MSDLGSGPTYQYLRIIAKMGRMAQFYMGTVMSIEGTPLPESQNFLDIQGKNFVIFYKFSRFISEIIKSFYQNIFQLMFKKKKS